MSPANYLQRYIDARGITCAEISTATGIGYHTVQKTVINLRCGTKTREMIARYLGLDPAKTWGQGNALYLRNRIVAEINKRTTVFAESRRQKLLKKYLDDGNVAEKGAVVNV